MEKTDHVIVTQTHKSVDQSDDPTGSCYSFRCIQMRTVYRASKYGIPKQH